MGIILLFGLVLFVLSILSMIALWVGVLMMSLYARKTCKEPTKRKVLFVVAVILTVAGYCGTLPAHLAILGAFVDSTKTRVEHSMMLMKSDVAVMKDADAQEFMLGGERYYLFDYASVFPEELRVSLVGVEFNLSDKVATLAEADPLKNAREDNILLYLGEKYFGFSPDYPSLYIPSQDTGLEILLESDHNPDAVNLFDISSDRVWFSESAITQAREDYYGLEDYNFFLSSGNLDEPWIPINVDKTFCDLLVQCKKAEDADGEAIAMDEYFSYDIVAVSKDGMFTLEIRNVTIIQYQNQFYWLVKRKEGVVYCIEIPVSVKQ